MFDILLLGATGFTGRQTAMYLAAHPEAGTFTWAIAGRSIKKLEQLAKEISLPEEVKIFEADVTNYSQLEEVVKQARIVLTTVGPYAIWGTPVVKACATHGVHYLDITGETEWKKQIIKQFDYLASKNGAIMIPSSGFDSVPSDLSAYLGRKTLSQFSSERLAVTTSVTAFRVAGGISGGTLATAINMFETTTRAQRNVIRKDYYLSPLVGAPSPGPKLVYQLRVPGLLKPIIGGFWFMQPTNKALVQQSWGLFEREAQNNPSAATEAARYGPSFSYDEFMVTPGKLQAVMFTLGLLVSQICLSIGPIRRIIAKFLPPAGSGPTDEVLKNSRFKTTNITTAVSSQNSKPIYAKTVISGQGDPGYYLTPIMLAEGAFCILRSKDSLPALGKRGGILTPATALGDVLVERLKKHSLFQIESMIVSDEDKKDI